MYKYIELAGQLEKIIENGAYSQGAKLPSIRSICKDYNAHKSTVIKALEILVDENLIYVVPQSGYYVLTRQNSLYDEETDIDFATSSPNPSLFPYQDFQLCINQAIQKYQAELFLYGTARGLNGLIDVSVKSLMKDQIFTKAKNLVITSGVQQALSLLIDMPFPSGKDTILVEQPTYHLFLDQLQTLGKSVSYIERTHQGIDLEKLEKIFATENIKFFYTMPRFHNPLGSSLADNQKQSLMDLAYKYDVYIVEDDFLSDYETNPKADPLFAYDSQRRYTIYLKSYSKIIFPGLRVGVSILPDDLVDVFIKRKVYADIDSSMISQAALEIYHRSGMFKKHAKKMNSLYKKRADTLHGSLEKLVCHTPSIRYTKPSSKAVFTCLELDHPAPVSRLKDNNIHIMSASENFSLPHAQSHHYLRLNVTNTRQEKIEIGLEKLFQLL